MLFFFLDRGRIEAEKLDDVLPMDKQLAHFLLRGMVFGISLLFPRKQLRVLALQALDGGQLFQPQLVKRCL